MFFTYPHVESDDGDEFQRAAKSYLSHWATNATGNTAYSQENYHFYVTPKTAQHGAPPITYACDAGGMRYMGHCQYDKGKEQVTLAHPENHPIPKHIVEGLHSHMQAHTAAMRGPKHAFMVSKPSYDSLAYAIDVAYAVEAMYDCVTVFIPPAPNTASPGLKRRCRVLSSQMQSYLLSVNSYRLHHPKIHFVPYESTFLPQIRSSDILFYDEIQAPIRALKGNYGEKPMSHAHLYSGPVARPWNAMSMYEKALPSAQSIKSILMSSCFGETVLPLIVDTDHSSAAKTLLFSGPILCCTSEAIEGTSVGAKFADAGADFANFAPHFGQEMSIALDPSVLQLVTKRPKRQDIVLISFDSLNLWTLDLLPPLIQSIRHCGKTFILGVGQSEPDLWERCQTALPLLAGNSPYVLLSEPLQIGKLHSHAAAFVHDGSPRNIINGSEFALPQLILPTEQSEERAADARIAAKSQAATFISRNKIWMQHDLNELDADTMRRFVEGFLRSISDNNSRSNISLSIKRGAENLRGRAPVEKAHAISKIQELSTS